MKPGNRRRANSAPARISGSGSTKASSRGKTKRARASSNGDKRNESSRSGELNRDDESSREADNNDRDSRTPNIKSNSLPEVAVQGKVPDQRTQKATKGTEPIPTGQTLVVDKQSTPRTRSNSGGRDAQSQVGGESLKDVLAKVNALDLTEQDYRDKELFKKLSFFKREEDERQQGKSEGEALIYKLPKSEWWRLFIDRAHHSKGPLGYDGENSPGYYYAMMTAFEKAFSKISLQGSFKEVSDYLSTRQNSKGFFSLIALSLTKLTNTYLIPTDPNQILDANTYLTYHEDVRKLVLTELSPEKYVNIASGWSGRGVDFPMNADDKTPINFTALEELINDGVIFIFQTHLLKVKLPEAKEGAFVGVTISEGKNDLLMAQASTQYDVKNTPDIVNRLFARYYSTMAKAKNNRLEALRAIVTLIRNLHVGHFFPDANGRVNIMLLLNYFLMENGFNPALLQQPPGIFGGGATVNELVQAVTEGMSAFLKLVSDSLKQKLLSTWSPYEINTRTLDKFDDETWRVIEQSIKSQLTTVESKLLENYNLVVVDGTHWTCYIRAVLLGLELLNTQELYEKVMSDLGKANINLPAQGGVEIGSTTETVIQAVIKQVTKKDFYVRARSVFDEDRGQTSQNKNGQEVLLLHTGVHFSLLIPKDKASSRS